MSSDISAFSEVALITITRLGGSDMQFAARIEDIDIDVGDKDIEVIPNLKGGRIVKKVPQAESTIAFTCYQYGLDQSTAPTGFGQLFHGQTTYDTTEPLTVIASRIRDLYRVAILWTEDTSVTSAAAATTAAKVAERFVAANCYLTGYKLSFADQLLKCTATFKVAPFNKEGIGQIREESTETTTALTALNSYNTTNFVPGSTVDYTW